VYARASGEIEPLLKITGDAIQKNETIAIIENSANYKAIFLLKSILDTLSVEATIFSFLINGMPP